MTEKKMPVIDTLKTLGLRAASFAAVSKYLAASILSLYFAFFCVSILDTLLVPFQAKTKLKKIEFDTNETFSQLHWNDWNDHTQFVHIPKNGGTFIENWASHQKPPLLFGSKRELKTAPIPERPWKISTEASICNISFDEEGGGRGWSPSCCSWWHVPPRMFIDFDIESQLFAVLRDPIERIVSQQRWEERLHLHKCEISANTTERNSCFSHNIRQRLRQLKQNPMIVDCHYLGQYLFVTDDRDRLLPNVEILCIETLDEDLKSLFPNLSHFVNLSQHERNESIERGKVVLEADVVEMLKKVYAQDFSLHRQFCSSGS